MGVVGCGRIGWVGVVESGGWVWQNRVGGCGRIGWVGVVESGGCGVGGCGRVWWSEVWCGVVVR